MNEKEIDDNMAIVEQKTLEVLKGIVYDNQSEKEEKNEKWRKIEKSVQELYQE